MMTEVTRGEFDMLKSQVTDSARRIDAIDQSGTRGVGIVQVQLTDLAKDVAALGARMDTHDREHESEARDRRSSRRWMVATAIAFMAMLETPLIYLVSVHH
jgi:hypothetical protein